jgi:hypothetical protein
MLKPATEKRTLTKMISYYCKRKHGGITLCNDCEEILRYATTKLDACIFGRNKPVCSECSVHCYRKNEREKMKEIMRFAGPRMIFIAPRLAIAHLVHKYRSKSNMHEILNKN